MAEQGRCWVRRGALSRCACTRSAARRRIWADAQARAEGALEQVCKIWQASCSAEGCAESTLKRFPPCPTAALKSANSAFHIFLLIWDASLLRRTPMPRSKNLGTHAGRPGPTLRAAENMRTKLGNSVLKKPIPKFKKTSPYKIEARPPFTVTNKKLNLVL